MTIIFILIINSFFYALFKHGIVISCQGKHTIKLEYDLYDLHQSLAFFAQLWN